MAFVAFLLAAIQFALIAFGVDVFDIGALREVAGGLFLVALGLALPGTLALYESRRG